MIRRPPRSTRTDTIFPYTTLFRSGLVYIEQDHSLANSDTPPGFGIAGLQLDLAPGDNLDRIASEVAQVARRFPWVRMVLLGELCGFGVNTAHAQGLPGDAEEILRSAARNSGVRSDENTSELQSLMRHSSAVYC